MRLITLIFLLIFPCWAVANQYICITEDAAGFYYNEDLNKWKSTRITSDIKYLVSLKDMNVKQFGKEVFIFEECSEATVYGIPIMMCLEDFGEFQMGVKTLKFLRTIPYFNVAMDNPAGTPNMEIGTCSKF